ncbi:MAG: DUF932 domain-containing protein [Pseudobacter sp.]|uniref:DUF932 domain-containing protein n=1 Tax=Pseudobacter sp. TaxID=2045420 RepID=UPI003F802593
MAHNLNYNSNTQQHSFFSVKESAWHGLGQIVHDYPTSKEALQFAGLNYTVEKRPLFTTHAVPQPDTEIIHPDIAVPDYYATVRTDSNAVLGVVGQDYKVVQNVDAFEFFDAIVGGDGIQYETAGALGKGERIFITAKLPNYIRVANDDLIKQYLFLTTSHDGFGSIIAAFTPIRIVCNNTLNAAMSQHSNAIKIRHTTKAKDRLAQAHEVLGITNKLSEELESIFNQWAKVRITDVQVKQLIQRAMAPSKEVLHNVLKGVQDSLSQQFTGMVDQVYRYAMSSPSQQTDTTKGSVFGAYNAVTGYFQNVRNYKNDEAKLKSIMLGGVAQLRTQAAFDLCKNFAIKGQDAFLMN